MLTRNPNRRGSRRRYPPSRERPAGGDAGQALLIVLALIAVIASVPMIVVGTTVGGLTATNENLYWNAAYEASQAGLNDYVQHLDADETFAQWSSGLGYTYYCTSPYPAGAAYDSAFCGWVPLSSTTNPLECYEYSLPSISGGALQLTVSGEAVSGSSCTGWATGQGALRTFTFDLAPQDSFLDDIYWTNYESEDPLFPGCSADAGTGAAPDNGVWYQGTQTACPIWFFGAGSSNADDTINGPLFSNDTLRVLGTPTYNGPVYSAAGSSRSLPGGGQATTQPLAIADTGDHTGCAGDSGTPAPNWNDGCPQNAAQQTAPSTAAYENAARTVGCYITGMSGGNPAPTWVDMTLSESGSPAVTTLKWTKDSSSTTTPVVDNASTDTNSCGSTTTSITVNSTNLKAALIYVNGNITISNASSNGGTVGYMTIMAGDDNSVGPGSNPKNSAQAGDAGYITIDGNLTYPSADISGSGVNGTDTTDALGLVAQYFIGIENTLTNPTIDAALLAVDGSVFVQNWDSGTAEAGEDLTIFGSMAQDFRGPVATANGSNNIATGYIKNYEYDNALQLRWPPYFLSSTSATWAPVVSSGSPGYSETQPGCANRAISQVLC